MVSVSVRPRRVGELALLFDLLARATGRYRSSIKRESVDAFAISEELRKNG